MIYPPTLKIPDAMAAAGQLPPADALEPGWVEPPDQDVVNPQHQPICARFGHWALGCLQQTSKETAPDQGQALAGLYNHVKII